MARVSHEYRIQTGDPDEKLSAQLTELSSRGWDVIGVAHGAPGVICVLRREKDFEVARSLQAALEQEANPIDAVAHIEIPPDELGASAR